MVYDRLLFTTISRFPISRSPSSVIVRPPPGLAVWAQLSIPSATTTKLQFAVLPQLPLLLFQRFVVCELACREAARKRTVVAQAARDFLTSDALMDLFITWIGGSFLIGCHIGYHKCEPINRNSRVVSMASSGQARTSIPGCRAVIASKNRAGAGERSGALRGSSGKIVALRSDHKCNSCASLT